MSFTLEASKTGKDTIIFNKYKYRESYSVKNGDVVWKCLGRNCKASVTTNGDKTGIFSINECHTGSHPVTLRTLSPAVPESRRSHITSPNRDSYVIHTPQTSSYLSVSSSPTVESPSAHKQGEGATSQNNYDIELENNALKEELKKLRNEMKMVLDHSIESDQRLLQFTEDVFPNPCTIKASDNLAVHHSETLTDSAQHSDLDKANFTIRQLQQQIELLNGPCQTCAILKEEVGNMINSLRCLEAENIMLKNNNIKNKTTTIHHLALHNKFDVLSEDEEHSIDKDQGYMAVTKKRVNHRPKRTGNDINQTGSNITKKGNFSRSDQVRKTPNIPRHTPFNAVTVLGDSHARNLAKLVGDRVTENTSVSGICKPGAGLMNMKPTKKAPSQHCYVLVAGTNDVDSRREDVIFNHLEEVMLTHMKTSSVLVVPLTTRYDHPSNSHIHHTVNRVNTFMAELCCRHDNVELLDIKSIKRQHYTSHGLHLRNSGKRLLAELIANTLSTMRSSHSLQSLKESETPENPDGQSSPSVTSECGTYAEVVSKSTPAVMPRENLSLKDSSPNHYFLRKNKTLH